MPDMNYNELILKQLDRLEAGQIKLEERTKDIVTRSDLEALRKELVARDSLEPQLNALKGQIERVDKDRVEDKKNIDKRIDDMEKEQLSKQDRLWMRITQTVGIAGFAIAVFEMLAHFKWIP